VDNYTYTYFAHFCSKALELIITRHFTALTFNSNSTDVYCNVMMMMMITIIQWLNKTVTEAFAK